VVIAASCPLCERKIAWAEVPPGATAVPCPNCQAPVEVERPPPPMPPPMFVPLGRDVPQAATAADRHGGGPRRRGAAAAGGVSRRAVPHPGPGLPRAPHRRTLTIEFPHRRAAGPVNPGAVVWAAGCGLIAMLTPAGLGVMLGLGLPPLGVSLALRRRRYHLTIGPRTIVGPGVRLARELVTHIFCVGVYQGTWTNVVWQVRLRAGNRDHLLATTDALDDANALASLLATELGLPTWVPQPLPPR
jgi:endogenous inhibitor of DNA gyrase (YacG/DUF329 family)